jgi:hypothetical protein
MLSIPGLKLRRLECCLGAPSEVKPIVSEGQGVTQRCGRRRDNPLSEVMRHNVIGYLTMDYGTVPSGNPSTPFVSAVRSWGRLSPLAATHAGNIAGIGLWPLYHRSQAGRDRGLS